MALLVAGLGAVFARRPSSMVKPETRDLRCSCAVATDTGRERTLVALAQLVLDELALDEGAEALGLDRRVVHEAIAPVVAANEAVALRIVEPLHRSRHHGHVLPRSCVPGHDAPPVATFRDRAAALARPFARRPRPAVGARLFAGRSADAI